MTGTPGDEVDQRWSRIARISLGALLGAGIALALSIEYLERGSHVAQVELEGLLMIGILPTWMVWAGIAGGRLGDQWGAPRGIVAAVVLAVLVLHMLVLQSFGWYLDVLEPLSAAWAGLWFLAWLLTAGLGGWLVWVAADWISARLDA